MKERPILFSGPMVRAILEGRKTQTRRIVKPQPPTRYTKLFYDPAWFWSPTTSGTGGEQQDLRLIPKSPYGVPGDRLWVKETFWMHSDPEAFGPDVGNVIDSSGRRRIVGYAASMDADSERCANDYGAKKRPSIHMPRWASRITLEVKRVRVERLQDISAENAIDEGAMTLPNRPTYQAEYRAVREAGIAKPPLGDGPLERFARLWDEINGDGAWAANPWVWVVEFKRVDPVEIRKAGGA